MQGFARRLVLIPRHKVNWKWSIKYGKLGGGRGGGQIFSFLTFSLDSRDCEIERRVGFGLVFG